MVDGDAAARFAAMVRQHLDGPVLCYEDRQTLLRTAARLGIGRFDANLIIAAVQHRAEMEFGATHDNGGDGWTGGDRTSDAARRASPPATRGKGAHEAPRGSPSRWWLSVAVVIAVETSLSLVAWWALRG
jgi:hypothetical protein